MKATIKKLTSRNNGWGNDRRKEVLHFTTTVGHSSVEKNLTSKKIEMKGGLPLNHLIYPTYPNQSKQPVMDPLPFFSEVDGCDS